MFEIIDNIEVPATAATRNRPRGAFAQAVDSLQVGQGFIFDSDKPLKTHYPKVSPSKFPSTEGFNKKFRLWIAGEGQVGVKRLPDVAVSEGDSNEGDAE
jgi:hypothetical protein